jgi:leucyl-tRNA synthetase
MSTSSPQVKLHYDPVALDRKWQDRWANDKLYRVDEDSLNPKWYELTMYPYPSGDLHIGHWYAMAPADSHARFRRMQGYNVLHPIGFDAFGLPAENAAIKRGVHPHTWTMNNIETMRRQLVSIGAIYDWDREIVCCSPEFYRWSQWLFLKLFHQGLAYRAEAPVVWCPSCQTVLANEQVVAGNCERCDTPTIHRKLKQWFLRITDYAEQLLDLSGLLDWPENILNMQRNWIGRREGVEIEFDISENCLEVDVIHTFTTRIDTVFGVSFLALAPEHPMVESLCTSSQRNHVEAYVAQSLRATELDRISNDKEKTGVFLGTYATNKVNGERVPMFIADYVLMNYGTGIVMGVPAHDVRDFAFAKKYDLTVRVVIAPLSWDGKEPNEAYLGDGFMTNSTRYDGMTNREAGVALTDDIESNKWGHRTVTYRIRDWLISRQRYWGTPIPIVYCERCGLVPVPEDELPVLLPEDAEFKPTGDSPLADHKEFLSTTCPTCGETARRETDTMDTFIDSSWYMLRYPSPRYENGPFDPASAHKWMPVDQYTGGAEHAVMHLLYARFFIKALRDIHLVDFDEPFLRLYNQGIILGEDHEKMSKSRGNVVNPDEVVTRLGADAVRCFLMFIGPWDQGGPWSDVGINGIARWLNRVWDLAIQDPSRLDMKSNDAEIVRETVGQLHRTIRKCNTDLDGFKFNTAIATLMEFSNKLSRIWAESSIDSNTWKDCIKVFLVLLAPMAPHITEELWERIGEQYSIHECRYPEWDNILAVEDKVTLVVQVNGKVRDRIQVPNIIGKGEAEELALASPRVRKYTEGKLIRKTVFVPGRLINLVMEA